MENSKLENYGWILQESPSLTWCPWYKFKFLCGKRKKYLAVTDIFLLEVFFKYRVCGRGKSKAWTLLEIVRPFIFQFFLVLFDHFYQKAVSLKRSHAFLTGNRVACKSVAWESFLFGSFPGKRFFTIQIKWLIYVYMIIWGLKSLVAPWLLLNFCLCSPILARSYCEHRHFFFTRY